MTKDTFHAQVRTALLKEGWTITQDPLKIEVGGVKLEIDLAAERSLGGLIAAERDNEKIAVEVKSFITTSPTNEFHTALGQFINYRTALIELELERTLYLAVPLAIYMDFFQLPFPQRIAQENYMRLLVYDPIHQEVVQWL